MIFTRGDLEVDSIWGDSKITGWVLLFTDPDASNSYSLDWKEQACAGGQIWRDQGLWRYSETSASVDGWMGEQSGSLNQLELKVLETFGAVL